MAFFNFKMLFSLSYCVPSFALYTLLIIMLIRSWKDFNSGFFRIVIADYCFNLFTFVNSMVTLRLPNGTCKECLLDNLFSQLGPNNPYTVSFLWINYFFHFGNAYFQYSMVTLMSLNRATSIFFYFINEKIWAFALPISLGIVIFITVFFTRDVLGSVPYFAYYESLDMYSITSNTNILSAYYNVIYFMAFAVSASVLLNVISVIRLKTIQNKISTVERNLLVATIFSSIIQCFAAMNTFILQIDLKKTTIWGQAAQVLLPFSSDFLTIAQPYILIFLSSKVREKFLQMYWKTGTKVNQMGFTKTNGAANSTSNSQVTRF
ncbi:unnamed protein product [Caenorhabditis sp. 36 PRJEB53466]|nr:unnamed protein product [Caenorhabditis sp. 36 PRJEB53466]